ncbi:MAG: hypothetical protein WDN28_24575 [Chthoniobacter sp.]
MTFRERIEYLDQKGALRAGAIGLILAVMIFFASIVTTDIQIAIGVVGLFILIALRFFKKNENTRVVFLSVASFLSLDYVFWRTFTTPQLLRPRQFLPARSCSISRKCMASSSMG